MPNAIEFEVQGLKELEERLSKGDYIMRVTLIDGLKALGKLIVPIKGTGPLADETPKRSGKLARSSFFHTIGEGTNRPYLTVSQPAMTPEGEFYGQFVREGTGLYGPMKRRIVPRTKKALAWGRDLGGGKKEFVFRSTAGQKPNPYHHRVLAMLMPQIQNIVDKMGERVTAYLSGGA